MDRIREHPALWAACYRVIDGRPWSFEGREYLFDLYEDVAQRICLQKAAQMGITESMINLALHALIARKVDVLYVLPTFSDASTFSAARFQSAIEESPLIEGHCGVVQNAFHKKISCRNLYIRGSNSRSQLKSIPVAYLMLDEFDEMDSANIALARERTSGHKLEEVREFNASTPWIPGAGIAAEYEKSDRRQYWVPCPQCGEVQTLTWPESISWDERDADTATWRCKACGERWSEDAKTRSIQAGKWRATIPGREIHGYHLSQLYSPTMTARRLVDRYREAQIDTWAMQEWYNSVLAEPYMQDAARLALDMIRARRTGPPMPESTTYSTAMGVDVGSPYCYWVVGVWDGTGNSRTVSCGRVDKFSQLSELMDRYKVRVCVIDAAPERHKTREFAQKHPGRVYVCYYPEMRDFVVWDHAQGVVNANRTETLDRYIARYRNGTIALPADIPEMFIRHHHNVVRVIRKNKLTGNAAARYEHVGDDHYAHAGNYCDIAGLLCGASVVSEIPEDKTLVYERAHEGDLDAALVTVGGDADEWGFDDEPL